MKRFDYSTFSRRSFRQLSLHSRATKLLGLCLLALLCFALAQVIPNRAAQASIRGRAASLRATATPGDWLPAPPMLAARSNSAISLLPSGKVLVVGGSRIGQNFVANVEIFDPVANAWQTAPPIPVAHRLTAQLLNTGDVLVAGDDDNTTANPSSYLFNEGTLSWTATTGAPSIKRYATTLTLLTTGLSNGQVLMAGGYVGGCCLGPTSTYKTTELYNPTSKTWSAGPDMNVARHAHTATRLPSGQVLVAGGAQRDPTLAYNSAEIYTPGANTWTLAASMAAVRYGHTATLLPSGDVLVVGGANWTTALGTVELYSPSGNVWSPRASLTVARGFHTATLLSSGKVLVAGGQDINGAAIDSAELYDPATNTWSDAGPLLNGRGRHVAALVPCGRVLVAGGIGTSGLDLATAESYTQKDQLITITPTSLGNGTVGQTFTQVFTASGGTPAYTYSQSGALPTGVTLLPDGTLTGIPEKSGFYIFTVKATDKYGCMSTVTIVWRVFCPTITIAPATVHGGTAGLNYLPVEQLTASGGTPVYTFVVTGGLLPTGMQLTTGGMLQGTPMQSGNFTITVTATDKFGCTGVREYTFAILCQTLAIGPQNMTLPDAMQEMNYNPSQPPAQTFTATGGCGQYTFSIVSGMLPAGMTLTSSGALTGTPTQNGDFEFTVKVTDKCGCMTTKVYKLKVTCPLRSLLNQKLFNTGVGNTGNPLTLLTPDAHYGVSYSSVSQTPLAIKELSGFWLPNTSASQWISPFANYGGPAVEYTYRTVFSLEKCDPGTAVIEGRWMADNSGKIVFNGVDVPGSAIANPGFNSWHNFTINSGFGALNTIEFKVTNNEGPTGLRVEFIRAFAKCCDCVAAPFASDMVAWWPLDEPKGAVVVNDIAGGNHGTPKPSGVVGAGGVLSTPAVVATGMQFLLGQVEVPHNPSLNFASGGFTIDAWIKTGQANTSIDKVIVDKLDVPSKRGYKFSVQGNKLVLVLGDGSLQTFTSNLAITFGPPWQFVAVTVVRSGATQTVQFHISSGGVLNSDPPKPITTPFFNIDSGVKVRIGGIEMFIDELELFKRPLPFPDLDSIFKAGPAGKCKPCVPPKVTLHPVSQTLCPGVNATLTAAASGSPVPVVQWQVMVGSGPWTDIPGATSTTLVVAAGALKNGNKYRAIFTNPCCDAVTNAATINIVLPPQYCITDTGGGGSGFGKNGGSGSLSIVVAAGAPITAASTADWLAIDSVETGAAGSLANAPGQTEQSATVYYTVAANDGARGRTGGLMIGGQKVAIAQAGANPVASVSAARFSTLPVISADSIVAAFGVGLAGSVQVATTVPLPTTLAGTQLKVMDAAGAERSAPLFFVSPNQINYLMPPGTSPGPALVTVTAGDGTVSTGTVQIGLVAPALFTADASGRGLPAANALLFKPDSSSVSLAVSRFDAALGRFVAVPLDFGAEGNRLFLVLYGTGIKPRSSLAGVTARIGGIDAPVLFADAQGGFVGLDQVNIEVPRALVGRGEVDVELTVDGQTVNVVQINVK